MLTWMSILLWFICMVFIYNTIIWKQIQHFTYIVAGQSSHLLIRAGTECFVGRLMGACARNMQSDPAEIKPAQCCIKLVFHLTYTMMHGSTKLKFSNVSYVEEPLKYIFFFFLHSEEALHVKNYRCFSRRNLLCGVGGKYAQF